MLMFDYKSLTDEQLKEMFNLHYCGDLNRTQLISLAFAMGEGLNSVAYWLPWRAGKTKLALVNARLWECKKILTICPKSAFGAWEYFIPKYTDYSFDFLTGSKKERVEKLNQNKNLYIINYEGMKSVYAESNSDRVCPDCRGRKYKLGYNETGQLEQSPCKTCKGTGTTNGWKVDFSSFDDFDCLIMDEAHRISDYKSTQSDICYELAKRAKYRVALSADPINNHYMELFNTYKVLDLGETFGLNFFAFRNKYFDCKQKRMRNGATYPQWFVRPAKEKDLLNAVSHNSITFARSEVSDVPENEPIEIKVTPSEEFVKLQKDIVNNKTIELKENKIDCETISLKGHKLLQLSSGFLYYEKDFGRKAYRLQNNPKLDKLIETIKGLNGKVIVWHKYEEEAHMIEELFQKCGIVHISMRGEIKKEKSEIEKEFAENKNIKVLLAQVSCSEGWNGVSAKYMIFFSPIAGSRVRNQCIGRILGEGQVPDYVIYDLIMDKSFDVKTKKNLKENKSFTKSVMEFIRTFGKNNNE